MCTTKEAQSSQCLWTTKFPRSKQVLGVHLTFSRRAIRISLRSRWQPQRLTTVRRLKHHTIHITTELSSNSIISCMTAYPRLHSRALRKKSRLGQSTQDLYTMTCEVTISTWSSSRNRWPEPSLEMITLQAFSKVTIWSVRVWMTLAVWRVWMNRVWCKVSLSKGRCDHQGKNTSYASNPITRLICRIWHLRRRQRMRTIISLYQRRWLSLNQQHRIIMEVMWKRRKLRQARLQIVISNSNSIRRGVGR